MSDLDHVFSALSDSTRRAIVGRLGLGAATVGELIRPFDISPPAISRHLRVLETASLINRERCGQQRVCRLNAQGLIGASDWLDHYRGFWTEGFDRLARHLQQPE